ncbi:hypothetical protein ACHAPT_000770 [Fusarium lateritium]
MTTVTAVQGRLVGSSSVLTFDTLLKRILSMHRVLLLSRQPAGSSGGGKTHDSGHRAAQHSWMVLHQDPAPPIQASDTVRGVGSHCSRGDPVNHCAVPQITLSVLSLAIVSR